MFITTLYLSTLPDKYQLTEEELQKNLCLW